VLQGRSIEDRRGMRVFRRKNRTVFVFHRPYLLMCMMAWEGGTVQGTMFT
jgi:hypothetical protein